MTLSDRTGSDEAPTSTGELRAGFEAGVRASAAHYLELPGWGEVASHVHGRGGRVAVAPSLDRRQPQLRGALELAGAEVVVPGGDDPAAEVADVAIGVVAGELGIAETGSVLVTEHDLGDRVTTMLCQRLVLVVERTTIAGRLEDAAAWLSQHVDGAGFAALITGPSRTADIERSLTIGVQGPQQVDVVVLG